jgi:transcriptional regulator with XRE-family HTH domain
MEQTGHSGTPINPRIGQRVMQVRREQGMTQHELAAQAGTGLAVITRLETGKQSVSAERLAVIAHVLRVSLDWLCARDGHDTAARVPSTTAASLPARQPEVRTRRQSAVPTRARTTTPVG